ncbi:MAG: class I SAM-dependent methyltransferase [Vulcanimicrobiota bacterium]
MDEPRIERPPGPGYLEQNRRLVEQRRLLDEVWEEETEEFLERLEISPGERVLELRCGPGLSLGRLARRVGARGEVVGFEPDALLAAEGGRRVQEEGHKTVRLVSGDFLSLALIPGSFDVVYCCWGLASWGERVQVLKQVRRLLSPSGRLGIFDFHREGTRMFPYTPAIEAVLQASVAYHQQQGTEVVLTGLLPELFLSSGFLLDGAWPRQKAEPPGALSYRWVESMLLELGPRLLESRLLDPDQWGAFLLEWEARRVDPKTLLFSPPAVGVLARPLSNVSL